MTRAEGRTVLRPARARVVVYGMATAVLVTIVGLAVALPSGGARGWGLPSRVGVVATGLAIAYVLHRLAAVRVETSEAGVLVVNVLNRRRLDWAEIVGVRLGSGDAWMTLDLTDGTTLAAMGVQHAEGARGQRQAERFAREVQQRNRVPGHD